MFFGESSLSCLGFGVDGPGCGSSSAVDVLGGEIEGFSAKEGSAVKG